MSKTEKSLIGGMTVLGISGIVCKLIGVLFSIPLTHIIGADGQGVYQAVFPTYNMLLTVSSAGLPVAVSRMVSHFLTRGDSRSAKQAFKVALYLLTAIGCVLSIAMLAGSDLLAVYVNQPEAKPGFMVIAPCVAIVCVLSAFRGFMQGQQDMVPTAVSQLIEQVGKVCISLPLAWFFSRRSIAWGAAGALLGVTIVEGLALIYMIILYLRRRGEFDPGETQGKLPPVQNRTLARQLVRTAVPITIGACIVPLASFIDSAMLVTRMLSAGLTLAEARPLYGLFSGMVIRLINIPTALALSISMSLVPAIASAMAAEDREKTRSQSDFGIRVAFLIGFPCSVGMSLLARHIICFFYTGTLTDAQITAASELLAVSSLTVVLFTVVQATSAILQGLQRQRIPMYTLAAGVVLKILLNYLLVGIPGFHIHGAPIASLVCYTVSMVPNLLYVVKYTGLRFNWSGWVLRPGLAALIMGLAVWGLRALLPVNHLTTLMLVAAGVGVYGAAALLVRAVSKEDFASLRRRGRK